jgi:Fic family protein
VSTSALEGTYAAFTDVLEADFLSDDEMSSEVAEVRNFVIAAEAALAWIEDRPISHDLPPVAASALAHYQFETLHPFNDGNGRLGRLVALLQLITVGELQSLVVNLSPWLKERESEYQAHLLEVSASGNFDPWVAFFCEALCAHAREAVGRVHDLLALQRDLLNRANRARVRGVGLLLTSDLIGFPMVTARAVAELYKVSSQAANNAVTRLAEIGILRQRTEGRYARIFGCDPVLNLLERP